MGGERSNRMFRKTYVTPKMIVKRIDFSDVIVTSETGIPSKDQTGSGFDDIIGGKNSARGIDPHENI